MSNAKGKKGTFFGKQVGEKLGRLKIGQRLSLGFGVAIVTMVAVILFGVAVLSSVRDAVEVDAHERYPQTVQAHAMKSELNEAVQAMRDVLLLNSPEEIEARLADLEQSMELAGKSLAELNRRVSFTDKERALKKSLSEAHGAFVAELDSFKELARSGQRDKATDVLYTRGQTAELALTQSLNNLVAYHEQVMNDSTVKGMEEISLAVSVMLGLTGLACLLAIGIGMLVTRSIVRPMDQAVQLAQRVAEGDLTASIEVRRQDETGIMVQNLKLMNESLARIVAGVRQGTDAMAAASSEIAQGNMDLASRTERQAASVERTAASIDGLIHTVQQNAENARQANDLAANASEVARKGGAVVEQVVETMESINESARKIVDIIAVIDGIAFQTNILALNAAVEAARAGEQGRGFAVVASEVRNLAQRSAEAAKEIKKLIGDSVERVVAGSKLAGEAGATMGEVVASVRCVTEVIAEISSASVEQSAGIMQVHEAFAQIDETTSYNAALVEQAAAAAGRLREEAALLAGAVGIFKLDAAKTPQHRSASSASHFPLLEAAAPSL